MVGFLFGAIAGGVAAYVFRDEIRRYMTERAPDLRQRAAEEIGSLGERAGGALDRAKSRIDTAVRTGQEKLRTAGGGSGGADVRPGEPGSPRTPGSTPGF